VAHQLVGKAAVAGLTISQALTSSHIEGDVRLPDLVSQSHSHPPLYREAGECETKVESVQKDCLRAAARQASHNGRAEIGAA
jgi:hypothetical protein